MRVNPDVWKRKVDRMESPVPESIVIIVTIPWGFYIYSNFTGYSLLITVGRTAVAYFVFAFVLYLFLLAIQNLPHGRLNRRLVGFTRRYIRFHKAAAIIGALWIAVHAYGMLQYISIQQTQAVTGLLTLVSLAAVLFSGYLRSRRSSGRRRRYHRYLSFVFIFFLLFHLFI